MTGPPGRPGRPGTIVWLTGLPGSGKTTLADAIAKELSARAIPCCTLDGDAVRDALVPRPGYSPPERDRFYASLANLAGLLAGQGLVVLVPATGHERRFRARARGKADRFVEIFVDTPLARCRMRAVGGVYAAEPTQVPGLGIAYEPPENPDVVAHGGLDVDAIEQAVAIVVGGRSPADADDRAQARSIDYA